MGDASMIDSHRTNLFTRSGIAAPPRRVSAVPLCECGCKVDVLSRKLLRQETRLDSAVNWTGGAAVSVVIASAAAAADAASDAAAADAAAAAARNRVAWPEAVEAEMFCGEGPCDGGASLRLDAAQLRRPRLRQQVKIELAWVRRRMRRHREQ